MAGIFHKGIRYSGFGNLWGMIKGNIASQTDLKEILDNIDEKASKDQYIIRKNVTASAGQIVRIPASGYDDRIRNSNGYEAQVVAGSVLSAVKISALNIISIGSVDEDTGITTYSRYAEITLAESITSKDIGLKITKIGDNSNGLRPAKFDELDGIKTKWFSQTSVKKLSDNTTVYTLERDGLYYFPHGVSGINEACAAFVFGFGYCSLVYNINDNNIIIKAGTASNDLRNNPITGILFYKTT